MSVYYSVWLLDPFGVRLALLSQYSLLEYTLVVNAIGRLVLEMPINIVPYAWLKRRDMRLAVYRSAGGRETLEGVFLSRRPTKILSSKGERIVRLRAMSANSLLTRRIVAYAAGSAQAEKSAPADDLIKAIARENMGALATDTSRDWSAYLSVQADWGAGPSVDKAFPGRNVLLVMQEVAQKAAQAGTPVYFDVVPVTESTFEFRTFVDRRGLDHSFPNGVHPLIVSPEFGNLVDAELEEDYEGELTYVYAAGEGKGDDRATATASDAVRIGSSPFGRIEGYRDCRNTKDLTALADEAAAKLRAGRPVRRLRGTMVDMDGCRYGQNWGFGDVVTAEFDGEQFDCTVDVVSVSVRSGVDTIKVGLYAEAG